MPFSYPIGSNVKFAIPIRVAGNQFVRKYMLAQSVLTT